MSMVKAVYQNITLYTVEVECKEPLHIGSASGDHGEILTDPVTGMPFVQASSLAGICLDYCKSSAKNREWGSLFGSASAANSVEGKSRILFTDGIFEQNTVKVESRTRIRINGATGSGQNNEVAGTGIYTKTGKEKLKSGQLHGMFYIADGARFRFAVICMDQGEQCMEACFAAMQKGRIVLGGMTTIGCGRLSIVHAGKKNFHMNRKEDRQAWAVCNPLNFTVNQRNMRDITNQLSGSVEDSDYVVSFTAEINSALLVKADRIEEEKVCKGLKQNVLDRMPDAMNLCKNGDQSYYIPGSSLKGVFRSRMESIAEYLHISGDWMEWLFSNRSKIMFENAVIHNEIPGGGEHVANISRTRINKLSGGVKYQALFSELVTAGTAKVVIRVTDRNSKPDMPPAEAILGLLLYAVRDLAAGMMSIGSGASIGRGFVSVRDLEIAHGTEKPVRILLNETSVKDEFVVSCLRALQEVAE